MNASAAPTSDPACSACGEPAPSGARFCPACGSPVGTEGDSTLRAELPPDETGPVPVAVTRVQPRFFGLTPPTLTLSLAALAVAAAVALFATGHWPLGLILLGVAVLCFALFLEAARRKPDTVVTRVSAGALLVARGRASAALELVAARGRAGRESLVLRRRLAAVRARRRELLTAFGDAVYRGDEAAAGSLRPELDGLGEQERGLEAELQRLAASTRERIEKARLSVQDTQLVQIPEPYPPPDEGNPPTPAIVPEPLPPPDEGTPPQPDPVPPPDADPER